MDALIAFLISKFGWGALVGGFVMYLLIEGSLDIATDIISHRIIKNKERKERGE